MENDDEVSRFTQEVLAMRETDPERYAAFTERMLDKLEIDSLRRTLADVVKQLQALKESAEGFAGVPVEKCGASD